MIHICNEQIFQGNIIDTSKLEKALFHSRIHDLMVDGNLTSDNATFPYFYHFKDEHKIKSVKNLLLNRFFKLKEFSMTPKTPQELTLKTYKDQTTALSCLLQDNFV